MKNLLYTIIVFSTIILSTSATAQVGISTSTPNASLDIVASDAVTPSPTDGVLVPRLMSFPAIAPTAAQHGMLMYMQDPAAYAGTGFYFWDNDKTLWLPLGETQWVRGTDSSGDGLIYAARAKENGTNVVVKDDGKVGVGTSIPSSELHVVGIRSGAIQAPEMTVRSNLADAEISLVPGGTGATYTIAANNDSSNGLSFYEGASEVVQIKNGGDLRIDELRSTKNAGITYPASVYVESDGTLKVTTAYSRLDDLIVNTTNFATVAFAETSTTAVATTATLYTHTVTPTQDILLEMSYHLSVRFSEFGSATNPIGEQHNTKLYGVVVRINGVDHTLKSGSFIGNDGLNGDFLNSDHLYIPLVADGTTYTITMHGYVQNDRSGGSGIRGTYGGNAMDRLQIVEHK